MNGLEDVLDLSYAPDMTRMNIKMLADRKTAVDIDALRKNNPEHWKLATAIRSLTLDAVAAANSGHSGMPMGMADVATVLYQNHLNFDPTAPDWPDRDRFVLSAGHGSMLLYALMYLTGYEDITLQQIKDFRQWGAKTAGHPEYGHARGIETTTGPLGQGIANSVGFAIAEEIQRARWGKNIVNHHTYVMAGDGCLMEGVSQEAIGLAGMQELGNLIVFWDNNNITIDGTVDIADKTNQRDARFAKLSAAKQTEFQRIYAGEAPKKLASVIRAFKKTTSEEAPKVATRKSSEMVLGVVNPIMPETIGGSADLTGSNNTKTADMGVFHPDTREGRYIYYGVREHGMAAAMNGMALHGGARPYGGTFMCFTDYARGAMRLSALMGVPATYVMTHDSIGLGEDGPTHQPVEHLAMLRATPNTHVFRPADTVETAEAWELALTSQSTPHVLCLSRQGLPTVRHEHKTKNLSAQGAYVLQDADGKRQAIIIATGSEVEVALAARDLLQAEGIGTRVVSMPCAELFAQQDEAYRKRVLPAGPVRVAVEAGVRFGWDQWLMGERGNAKKAAFVGMDGFGASAPAGTLFEQFGITAQNVADQVKALIK